MKPNPNLFEINWESIPDEGSTKYKLYLYILSFILPPFMDTVLLFVFNIVILQHWKCIISTAHAHRYIDIDIMW